MICSRSGRNGSLFSRSSASNHLFTSALISSSLLSFSTKGSTPIPIHRNSLLHHIHQPARPRAPVPLWRLRDRLLRHGKGSALGIVRFLYLLFALVNLDQRRP